MSIERYMDKENVVQTYNRILFSFKKKKKRKRNLPCCQGLLGEGNGELFFKGYEVSTLQDNQVLGICRITLCS